VTTFTSRGIIFDDNNQNGTYNFSAKDKSLANILNAKKRKVLARLHVESFF
jgi:hypothetical protein